MASRGAALACVGRVCADFAGFVCGGGWNAGLAFVADWRCAVAVDFCWRKGDCGRASAGVRVGAELRDGLPGVARGAEPALRGGVRVGVLGMITPAIRIAGRDVSRKAGTGRRTRSSEAEDRASGDASIGGDELELILLDAAGLKIGVEEVASDAPGEEVVEGAVHAATDRCGQGGVRDERKAGRVGVELAAGGGLLAVEMSDADEAVNEEVVASEVLGDLWAEEEEVGMRLSVLCAAIVAGGVEFEADPGQEAGFVRGLPAVHAAADGVVLGLVVALGDVGVAAVEFVGRDSAPDHRHGSSGR